MTEPDEHARRGGRPSGLLSRVRDRLTGDDGDANVPRTAGLDDRFTAGVAGAWTPGTSDDRTVADD